MEKQSSKSSTITIPVGKSTKSKPAKVYTGEKLVVRQSGLSLSTEDEELNRNGKDDGDEDDEDETLKLEKFDLEDDVRSFDIGPEECNVMVKQWKKDFGKMEGRHVQTDAEKCSPNVAKPPKNQELHVQTVAHGRNLRKQQFRQQSQQQMYQFCEVKCVKSHSVVGLVCGGNNFTKNFSHFRKRSIVRNFVPYKKCFGDDFIILPQKQKTQTLQKNRNQPKSLQTVRQRLQERASGWSSENISEKLRKQQKVEQPERVKPSPTDILKMKQHIEKKLMMQEKIQESLQERMEQQLHEQKQQQMKLQKELNALVSRALYVGYLKHHDQHEQQPQQQQQQHQLQKQLHQLQLQLQQQQNTDFENSNDHQLKQTRQGKIYSPIAKQEEKAMNNTNLSRQEIKTESDLYQSSCQLSTKHAKQQQQQQQQADKQAGKTLNLSQNQQFNNHHKKNKMSSPRNERVKNEELELDTARSWQNISQKQHHHNYPNTDLESREILIPSEETSSLKISQQQSSERNPVRSQQQLENHLHHQQDQQQLQQQLQPQNSSQTTVSQQTQNNVSSYSLVSQSAVRSPQLASQLSISNSNSHTSSLNKGKSIPKVFLPTKSSHNSRSSPSMSSRSVSKHHPQSSKKLEISPTKSQNYSLKPQNSTKSSQQQQEAPKRQSKLRSLFSFKSSKSKQQPDANCLQLPDQQHQRQQSQQRSHRHQQDQYISSQQQQHSKQRKQGQRVETSTKVFQNVVEYSPSSTSHENKLKSDFDSCRMNAPRKEHHQHHHHHIHHHRRRQNRRQQLQAEHEFEEPSCDRDVAEPLADYVDSMECPEAATYDEPDSQPYEAANTITPTLSVSNFNNEKEPPLCHPNIEDVTVEKFLNIYKDFLSKQLELNQKNLANKDKSNNECKNIDFLRSLYGALKIVKSEKDISELECLMRKLTFCCPSPFKCSKGEYMAAGHIFDDICRPNRDDGPVFCGYVARPCGRFRMLDGSNCKARLSKSVNLNFPVINKREKFNASSPRLTKNRKNAQVKPCNSEYSSVARTKNISKHQNIRDRNCATDEWATHKSFLNYYLNRKKCWNVSRHKNTISKIVNKSNYFKIPKPGSPRQILKCNASTKIFSDSSRMANEESSSRCYNPIVNSTASALNAAEMMARCNYQVNELLPNYDYIDVSKIPVSNEIKPATPKSDHSLKYSFHKYTKNFERNDVDLKKCSSVIIELTPKKEIYSREKNCLDRNIPLLDYVPKEPQIFNQYPFFNDIGNGEKTRTVTNFYDCQQAHNYCPSYYELSNEASNCGTLVPCGTRSSKMNCQSNNQRFSPQNCAAQQMNSYDVVYRPNTRCKNLTFSELQDRTKLENERQQHLYQQDLLLKQQHELTLLQLAIQEHLKEDYRQIQEQTVCNPPSLVNNLSRECQSGNMFQNERVIKSNSPLQQLQQPQHCQNSMNAYSCSPRQHFCPVQSPIRPQACHQYASPAFSQFNSQQNLQISDMAGRNSPFKRRKTPMTCDQVVGGDNCQSKPPSPPSNPPDCLSQNPKNFNCKLTPTVYSLPLKPALNPDDENGGSMSSKKYSYEGDSRSVLGFPRNNKKGSENDDGNNSSCDAEYSHQKLKKQVEKTTMQFLRDLGKLPKFPNCVSPRCEFAPVGDRSCRSTKPGIPCLTGLLEERSSCEKKLKIPKLKQRFPQHVIAPKQSKCTCLQSVKRRPYNYPFYKQINPRTVFLEPLSVSEDPYVQQLEKVIACDNEMHPAEKDYCIRQKDARIKKLQGNMKNERLIEQLRANVKSRSQWRQESANVTGCNNNSDSLKNLCGQLQSDNIDPSELQIFKNNNVKGIQEERIQRLISGTSSAKRSPKHKSNKSPNKEWHNKLNSPSPTNSRNEILTPETHLGNFVSQTNAKYSKQLKMHTIINQHSEKQHSNDKSLTAHDSTNDEMFGSSVSMRLKRNQLFTSCKYTPKHAINIKSAMRLNRQMKKLDTVRISPKSHRKEQCSWWTNHGLSDGIYDIVYSNIGGNGDSQNPDFVRRSADEMSGTH
ncbi:hypothetical protein HELRODRAFT_181669 [Helobdella robusta]|uniref:Uncharacterized protein n=1 Tax=Helobdella robusta TaxID=6412 RepID=T1FH80_HELRO|nr:hypothetical protein HELRODRAFT_181669 [Helobdella robusta]ESN92200.1 hypothetical protein HELRODRAFT_181669 [Helobdella robusta]